MRLLAVYPYLPYPPDRGAYYRGFHLLRSLAGAYRVDLIALAENGAGTEHEAIFAQFCDRVQVVPFQHPPWEKLFPKRLLNPLPATVAHWTLPHFENALRRWLADAEYDAVHIFDIVLGQYFLKSFSKIPLVADRTRVDLQYQWMEQRRMPFSFRARLLALENGLKLWRYERAIAQRALCQIVCGPDDEQFLRRYISRRARIHVIPNGVDLDYFNPNASPPAVKANDPTIVFCGAMDYNPNIDALRWYFSEMDARLRVEIPGLRVLVVGKDPVDEVKGYTRHPHVTVTGAVPDVRPYYRQAWLQIVPLRIGGGTRLKIVESMAMGTPVVSTTIGAQGLGLQHECDALLADTTDDFISQTARALRDGALRKRLASRGFETVRHRLSWESLGRQMVDSYAQLEQMRPSIKTAPWSERSRR